jgi:RNA polymerase sigma-70 factor (ECF subfamily)
MSDLGAALPILDGEDVDARAAASAEVRLRRAIAEHSDFTWRSLRRLGLPAHVCDDATQRVFVVLSQRIADVEIGLERAFLFKTAQRVACSERRAVARRREVLDGDSPAEWVDPAAGADQLLDQRRARELLEDVLEKLPMDLRAVFILFELEGMTVAQIAECVSIPAGTASSRLRRAREEFQAELKRRQASRSKRGAR